MPLFRLLKYWRLHCRVSCLRLLKRADAATPDTQRLTSRHFPKMRPLAERAPYIALGQVGIG